MKHKEYKTNEINQKECKTKDITPTLFVQISSLHIYLELHSIQVNVYNAQRIYPQLIRSGKTNQLASQQRHEKSSPHISSGHQ